LSHLLWLKGLNTSRTPLRTKLPMTYPATAGFSSIKVNQGKKRSFLNRYGKKWLVRGSVHPGMRNDRRGGRGLRRGRHRGGNCGVVIRGRAGLIAGMRIP
jgi:hypothetical protein